MTIYLDNNATTKIDPEVVSAMEPYLTELYGNPSSIHKFGGQVGIKIKEARNKVASLLGASDNEIIFTAGGSEADNLAIRGTLEALEGRKKHIITTRVEHPAVRSLGRHLQKHGYTLTEIPVDSEGALDLEMLEKSITADTAIVSVMWANNETGVLFPIKKIAEIVKSKGAVFHTDAVQAVGKVPIDLSKIPIDLLSLSSHKIHGPKGVGALYVRKGTKINPLIIGGHQEFGKRAGTENVPGIIGLGKACELLGKYLNVETEQVKSLRDQLQKRLLESCPYTRVNGGNQPRLPNTANISFEYIEGEAILLLLDELNIAASSGSACTSGSLEPSHVLRAMGVPFTLVHGSIRFSLSRFNTKDEINYVIEHMPPIINRLREISPFWLDKVSKK